MLSYCYRIEQTKKENVLKLFKDLSFYSEGGIFDCASLISRFPFLILVNLISQDKFLTESQNFPHKNYIHHVRAYKLVNVLKFQIRFKPLYSWP